MSIRSRLEAHSALEQIGKKQSVDADMSADVDDGSSAHALASQELDVGGLIDPRVDRCSAVSAARVGVEKQPVVESQDKGKLERAFVCLPHDRGTKALQTHPTIRRLVPNRAQHASRPLQLI